jgi:Ca-activated chloride channel family protein
MIEGIRFAHPWLLTLLLGVPFYALFRRRQRRRRTVRFPPLQYRAGEAGWRFWTQLAWQLEPLLLALVVAGLAGPYEESRLELIEDEGVDVMLVLDVSLSMLAEDLPPTRLEALRRIAGDFVARAGGNRVGIVIFAKDSYVQTPLTTDHRSLLGLLDGVTVYTLDQNKSGGTSVGDALLVAVERLQRSRVEGRDQSLVLITDGESNTGIEPELAARYVRQQGVRFYAIGVGGTEPVAVTFEGNPIGTEGDYLAVLDDRRLRAVTDLAGGRYYRATDVGILEEIFAELSRLESAPLRLRTVASRRSLARLPALAALGLLALHLALGGVFLRSPFR